MPFKFENKHLKMRKEDDRRIKLTEDDKKEIRKLYSQGGISQRQLAEMFNVSRRSIQFALDPEKLKKIMNKELKEVKMEDIIKKKNKENICVNIDVERKCFMKQVD